MRSIDYNTNTQDINGHANDASPSKGILRATSELPLSRQTRENDRKARTPDTSGDPKDKKRGKKNKKKKKKKKKTRFN